MINSASVTLLSGLPTTPCYNSQWRGWDNDEEEEEEKNKEIIHTETLILVDAVSKESSQGDGFVHRTTCADSLHAQVVFLLICPHCSDHLRHETKEEKEEEDEEEKEKE